MFLSFVFTLQRLSQPLEVWDQDLQGQWAEILPVEDGLSAWWAHAEQHSAPIQLHIYEPHVHYIVGQSTGTCSSMCSMCFCEQAWWWFNISYWDVMHPHYTCTHCHLQGDDIHIQGQQLLDLELGLIAIGNVVSSSVPRFAVPGNAWPTEGTWPWKCIIQKTMASCRREASILKKNIIGNQLINP